MQIKYTGYLFNPNKTIDAKKHSGNAKATIQLNGRLGFSSDAIKLMSLSPEQVIIFAEGENGDLAAIIREAGDENGFKVQKGGEYYYLRMKSFFDSQEVDYVRKKVIFDISETREEFEGKMVYKFTRRDFFRKDNCNRENIEE